MLEISHTLTKVEVKYHVFKEPVLSEVDVYRMTSKKCQLVILEELKA